MSDPDGRKALAYAAFVLGESRGRLFGHGVGKDKRERRHVPDSRKRGAACCRVLVEVRQPAGDGWRFFAAMLVPQFPVEGALGHSICGKPMKRTSVLVDSPARTCTVRRVPPWVFRCGSGVIR